MLPAERVCPQRRGQTIFLIEFAAEQPQKWRVH
jgi:hypothetical protein